MNIIRFEYAGRTHTVHFQSSYMDKIDFMLDGKSRFSWPGDYKKHSIERYAVAAYRKDIHNRLSDWAKRNGFANRGEALKFCRS